MRKTDDETILRMLKSGKTQKAIAEYFGVSPAAICKRVKRILPPPKSLEGLTAKEQKFAIAVSEGKTQTEAAMKSFDVRSRDSAKSMGTQLMQKPEVRMAVNELMEYHGMGRSYRVRRLKEHVDNHDPNVSLKALDQTWKIDGAYTEKPEPPQVSYADIVKEVRELDKLEKELRRQIAELDGSIVEGEIIESSDKD